MCDFTTTYNLSSKHRLQLEHELNIDGVVGAVISQLYDDRNVKDKTASDYFKTHYEPLKQAVYEGFGKRPVKIEYGTPNYEFLKQLQTNTAVFSIFKSHAAMKDMAALLKDTSGNLRTREQFKAEALKVDSTYRTSKLDTEYDTGVRTARMAANWQRYVKNKRLYPNLRYVRTKAATPDEKHLAYVGITRPVDDAFWNTHYPPNRWRCQCSVEPTDDAATDVPDNLPPVPDEFSFNAGKTGQVFNIEKSDYIKSVPPKEQPALIRTAKKMVDKEFAIETPYTTVYKSKNEGAIEAHPLSYDNKDYSAVYKAAKAFANAGMKARILPTTDDEEMRKALLPDSGIKGDSCPDLLIDDKIVADIKTIEGSGKNTIKHAISAAKGQCNNVVIDLSDKTAIAEDQAVQYILEKMEKEEMKDFGDVWLLSKGKLKKNPHKK